MKAASSDASAPFAPPPPVDVDIHNEDAASHNEIGDLSEVKSVASASHERVDANSQAVSHIKQIASSAAVTEEHAKLLFDCYDSRGEGTWLPSDLRYFLFDLQEAFDAPRVVPDEALHDVLKELQLNIDAPAGVTWVEFKSYLIFLQQAPLQTLHETVRKVVDPAALRSAVLVSSPTKLSNDVISTLLSPCGRVVRVWLFEDAEKVDPAAGESQALVVFAEGKSVEEALKLSGSNVLGHPATILAYQGQEFPTFRVTRKPSVISTAMAKMYLGVKKLDDKAHISSTIKMGVDTASTKLSAFAEEHKLKEKLKAASDSTSEHLKRADDKLGVSRTFNEVSEKYQLADKAQKAKEEAKRISDKVKANPHVQAVGSFFSNVASRVSQSLNDFVEDTRVAIADEQRRKTSNSPAPSGAGTGNALDPGASAGTQ